MCVCMCMWVCFSRSSPKWPHLLLFTLRSIKNTTQDQQDRGRRWRRGRDGVYGRKKKQTAKEKKKINEGCLLLREAGMDGALTCGVGKTYFVFYRSSGTHVASWGYFFSSPFIHPERAMAERRGSFPNFETLRPVGYFLFVMLSFFYTRISLVGCWYGPLFALLG